MDSTAATSKTRQPTLFIPHGGGPCFFMDPPPGNPHAWDAMAAHLRAAAAYGVVPYRARRGVVNGLAAAAPGLERKDREPTEEALIDLLRDPDAPVRTYAAKALRQAHVRSAVRPLEAFRRTLPLQEQVVVDACIASLQRGEDAKTAALEKQFAAFEAALPGP